MASHLASVAAYVEMLTEDESNTAVHRKNTERARRMLRLANRYLEKGNKQC